VRNRRETFVLANKDNELKRVGRTCIKDFLGHGCPDNIVNRLLYVSDVVGMMDEDWMEFGGYRPAMDVQMAAFLVACAALVKMDGWKSRGEWMDESTADIAWLTLTSTDRFSVKTNETINKRDDIDALKAHAEAARTWALTQDGESDYCHNLRTACALDFVTRKTRGIVASAIQCYNRELDRAEERKQRAAIKADRYLGEPGDKFGRKLTKKDKEKGATAYPAIEGTALRFHFCENRFGETTIVTVLTDDGQLVKWFGSNYDPDRNGIERGTRVSVVGTVKKQSEYRGNKETVLTRCVLTAL
jgi:hypothetical protein